MRRKTKKRIKIGLLVTVLVIGAAAFLLSTTTPTRNDHLKEIAECINNCDWSQYELTEEEQAQYTAYMSGGNNSNIMDKVVKPMFEVQDFGLWSVGTITSKDFEKQVSIGYLGMVTLNDKDELPRAVLDAYRNFNTDTSRK